MQPARALVRVRRRTESGAVAIMVALSMVALCVAAGFVVDLGLLRVDHQVNKSAQDAAAGAGANGLVPDLNNPTFHPFAGVCQALNYLKANEGPFSDISSVTWTNGDGGAIAGSPDGCNSSHASDLCTPAAPATWARAQADSNNGKFRVTIQSGYKILPPGVTGDATYGNVNAVTGGAFAEDRLDAYSGDLVDPTKDWGGCDQVAVIVTEIRGTTLGAPAAGSMGTRVRSVARVHIGEPDSPYALLILEQKDCQVLTNGNNGVAAINVDGYETHPGMIHSDSDGSGANCNKEVIVGQKADGVVAHEAPSGGAPGSISTVASTNQSDGIANVYSGPKPPGAGPTSIPIVTREVLDTIYLNGVTAARDSAAFAWAAASAPVTAPPGWTLISSCPTGNVSGTKLVVKCNNMNNNATFTDATDIIFTGTLGGGSSTIKMPKANNVYVVGGGSGNNAVGVDSGTQLSMHDNDAACPSLYDSSITRARLFVYGGSLNISGGFFRACNTTVILMGSDSFACLPASTPTYYPDGQVCNGLSKPGNGTVEMSGNNNVDWTGPNKVDDEIHATQADHDDLEDLALWTESSGSQGLGGNGTVHLAGVFAAPNAKPLKLNGTPVWQVQNSQYVVRTLENDGGAIFNMRPSPSLPVAPPRVTFELIR